MDFTLKVLGTASAMPVPDRFQSAQVLKVRGHSFLIDCGEGVQRSLMASRVPLQRLESVFISHIHGDHLFGLFPLMSTMGMMARTAPLNIYAPVSFGPLLRFFLSYYGEGLPFEVRHIPLSMKEPQAVYKTKSLEVLAFPLNHKIETFGFLFREKEPLLNVRKEAIEKYSLTLSEIGSLKAGKDVVRGGEVIPCAEAAYRKFRPRSYAYCSDTAPFARLAEWVKGVDALYHEATYTAEFASQAAARHHSTTLQAAQCAKEAGAGKLLIGHYSSRCRDIGRYEQECREVFAESYAMRDGDIIEIGT